MHPFLVDELGLVSYANKLKEQGHNRLFPDLTPTKFGEYAPKISKWFSNLLRKEGVKLDDGRSNKSFHSFSESDFDK